MLELARRKSRKTCQKEVRMMILITGTVNI